MSGQHRMLARPRLGLNVRHALVRSALALAFVFVLLLPASTWAQSFPNRPITLIVPFPAGGPADIGSRSVVEQVAASIGQPVLVENRAGAGGQIAASAVKLAAADGYTLFLANIGTHAINRTLYSNLSYDPVKDFAPVSLMFAFPHVLAVNPDSPFKTVSDLVQAAKAQPGKLSFASQGVGSGGHLLGEMLRHRTGINVVHIPYRGTAQALPDLLGGRVQFFFDGMPGAGPLVVEGKLRGLSVTDTVRAAMLPNVPTMAEAGFPDYELSAWFGVAAPAATPKEVVARLNSEIVKAIKHPSVQRRFEQFGFKGIGSSPEEFAAVIEQDTGRLGEIVRVSGAHAD